MNTKKKNNKNNKNNDVAGIICVIVSAFFLICLVTPLLSDIGVFIKNLTMGLFGYLSYPIVLCTMLYGILLLMNKKAVLSGKQIAFIALMAVSVVFILQTTLDAGKMNGTFGEYLSGLISFDPSNTTAGHSVGGVVFGIFAYAIKAALTFVGAYILYALLFVVFAALLVLDFRNAQAKAAQKRREPAPFVKGKSVAQPVRDVNDTSLFVGTIERTNKVNSESGDFENMYTPIFDSMPRYDSIGGNNPYMQHNNTPNNAPMDSEDKLKEKARQILFGGYNSDDMFKAYENQIRSDMQINDNSSPSQSGRMNYLLDDDNRGFNSGFYQPQTFTSSPSISPSNYNSASYNNSSSFTSSGFTSSSFKPSSSTKPPQTVLPEVAVPPVKDVSDQFVEGPIMNGDEVSQNLIDSKRSHKPIEDVRHEEADNEQVELPPIITGNPVIKKVQKEEPKEEQPKEDVELPPIITGNPVIKKKKPAVEPEKSSVKLPPILNGDNFTKKDNITEFFEQVEESEDDSNTVENEPEIESSDLKSEIKQEKTEYEVELSEKSIDEDDVTEVIEDKESDDDDLTLDIDEIVEQEEDATVPALEDSENDLEEVEEVADDFDVESKEDVDSYVEEDSDDVEEVEESVQNDIVEVDDLESDESQDQVDIEDEMSVADNFEDEEIQEAKIPDSLKLIEEEVDMSETREEIDNDNTGYYMTEGFDRNVDKIHIKLKDNFGLNSDSKDHNQINMDDYDVEIEEAKPKKQKKILRYTPPPIDLLVQIVSEQDDDEDYEQNARNLEEVLRSLKVDASVKHITRGPAVTRYELEMGPGQTVKRMPSYAEDIAYSLATHGKVRVQAPVTGKKAVGVEVPNKVVSVVSLREIIESEEFNEAKSCLTLALGKDIEGKVILCDLEKMPHLLIAGATGSGKSACLNSIIISLLYKSSPDDVRLILIDPKQVEFVLYREMPHLLLKNIINDSVQAINAFKWAREEMERRYTMFAKYAVRNLTEFNECQAVKTNMEVKLPRVVMIVDELAELMISKNSKELEQNLMSMAQKARAAGIHLILATQRPSVDVLTGTIKANLPSRIAFAVKSQADSRTILDYAGAETLLGKGDMLYAPTGSNDREQRVQGAFITTEEVDNIVSFVKNNNETDFDEDAANIIMKKPEENIPTSDEEKGGVDVAEDPLMKDVLRKVIETNQASASQIQRRFAVGYNRASRIIDQMEEKGYIGPLDGSKPRRDVYITREMFIDIYGEDI